jgi:hypothetical protein
MKKVSLFLGNIFRKKPKTFGNTKEMPKDWIKVCEDCKKPIQYGSPFAREFQELIDNGTGRISPTYSPGGNWNQSIHEPFAESVRKERLYKQFFCDCFTEKMIKDWEDENK